MLEKTGAIDTATKPIFDQAVWGAVPSVLWVTAVLVVFFCLRKEIRQSLLAVVARLRQGDSLKIAGFEVGATYGLVAIPGDFTTQDSQAGVRHDDGSRARDRAQLYRDSQGVMLVHQLQKSSQDGQIYDVLVYVMPHQSAAEDAPKCSLASVVSVEYFFGSFWDNKVFPSYDRSRGFPVVTSAYGPFLCTARLEFVDGTSTEICRYIDFEMGKFAPTPRG